jgi:hypothetical protein
MMMKKLLVLMLVLGLVSTASATMLSIRVGGTDVTSVTIPSVGASVELQLWSDSSEGTTHQYTAIMALPAGDSRTYGKFTGYTMASPTIGHPDINVSTLVADYAYKADNSGPTTDVLTAGAGFTFTLQGVAEGTGTVNLTELAPGSGLADSISFTVLPEPATMGLLAIGGLLLRRRK